MDKEIIKRIANELNIGVDQVSNTLKLLEEGSTVPFIARYRKEMTKDWMKNKFVSSRKNIIIKSIYKNARKK